MRKYIYIAMAMLILCGSTAIAAPKQSKGKKKTQPKRPPNKEMLEARQEMMELHMEIEKAEMHMELRYAELELEEREIEVNFHRSMKDLELEKQKAKLQQIKKGPKAKGGKKRPQGKKPAVAPASKGKGGMCGMGNSRPWKGKECSFGPIPGWLIGKLKILCMIIHILVGIWIYQDIRKRNADSGVWIVIGLLTGLLGALVYAVVRLGDVQQARQG